MLPWYSASPKCLNLVNITSSTFEAFGYCTGGPNNFVSSRISVFHNIVEISCSLQRNTNQPVWSTEWRQQDCFNKPSYFWNPYIMLPYATLMTSTYPNTTMQHLFLCPCLNQSHAAFKNKDIAINLDPMSPSLSVTLPLNIRNKNMYSKPTVLISTSSNLYYSCARKHSFQIFLSCTIVDPQDTVPGDPKSCWLRGKLQHSMFSTVH